MASTEAMCGMTFLTRTYMGDGDSTYSCFLKQCEKRDPNLYKKYITFSKMKE